MGFVDLRSRLLLFVTSLLVLALCVACGGGGGDDEDDDTNPAPGPVAFGGTISDTNPPSRVLGDVTVCALGVCDLSDANGSWNFTVPRAAYGGGDVSFSFVGTGIDTSATVTGLSTSADVVNVNFVIQPDGSAVASSVLQDGVDVTPPEDEEEDEPLSTDPEERACQILERSNISIPNVNTPIIQEVDTSCPMDINDLVVVGNSHAIPYDYEVTVDALDAVIVDPVVATAEQGTLTRHDGTYLCNRNADFVLTVTARVTRYYPPDGSPSITSEEAIALCGSGASVGNTTESVQVAFDVVEDDLSEP